MFAREGYPTMALVTIIAGAVILSVHLSVDHWIQYPVYITFFGIWILIISFFRDPDRTTPPGDHLVISPADGKIVQIKEVEEDIYLREKATQISIFLSPLNVHVNRNPVSGKLEYLKYHPGKYLMAWDENASELNERADFGVLHPSGTKIFFKQITGFLARRIVYHTSEGDEIVAGERFGIMKFGSRMDVIVPSNVEIKVKEGETTRAGESVLAEIR